MTAARRTFLILMLCCIVSCKCWAQSPAAEKLELELSNTNRQLDNLEKTWRQRWDDERQSLKDEREQIRSANKEDRDRAWLLFTGYIGMLLTLAGLLWAGLLWWIGLQRKELDKTIAQIPVMESNIRNFIVNISERWPETTATIEGLQLRVRLGLIRHQLFVEYIRELSSVLDTIITKPSADRQASFHDAVDRFANDMTNSLNLLSGSRRYVRLATNLFQDGEDMPTFTRELLPQLCEIYAKLDGELLSSVEELKAKMKIHAT
jgi:type II secretory pathway component PulM